MKSKGSCVVTISGVRVFARHGVLPKEKKRRQEFLIDIEIELDGPPLSDELSSTVDYADVASKAASLATNRSYDLIETLAFDIASSVLESRFARKATVTVKKPGASMPVHVECVGVTVSKDRPAESGGCGDARKSVSS